MSWTDYPLTSRDVLTLVRLGGLVERFQQNAGTMPGGEQLVSLARTSAEQVNATAGVHDLDDVARDVLDMVCAATEAGHE